MTPNQEYLPGDTVTYFRSNNSKRVRHEPRIRVGEVVCRVGEKKLLVRFVNKFGERVEKQLLASQIEKGVREGAQEL